MASMNSSKSCAVCDYFNQQEAFGVEQRFEPKDFEKVSFFWSPERIQINMEMTPVIKHLEAGEATSYAYEVRYLQQAPQEEAGPTK